MRTIFVFAYYSYKDPVFQSAVLPYLQLVKSENLRFVLLTWEQKHYKLSKTEANEIRALLLKDNIVWKHTIWHSGRLKLLKKLYDFSKGLIFCISLTLKYKVDKIYSEGFPGAVIGHFLSKITRKKHIVHTFEPHADYMKDAGVWTENSWEYKLLKKFEVPIANHCEHIITGTSAYRKLLIDKGVNCQIWVIPSCIDFEHFKYKSEEGRELRADLGIENNQILIVYMGKMGGMYMEEEIFQFFSHLLTIDSNLFRFLLLANVSEELVKKYCSQYNIPREFINQFYASKKQVPIYLSAADIGFCGVRPIPSQRYSSPIKNGEYWACGLPILIPKGISDDYHIAEKENIGLTFNNVEEITINDIEKLVSIPRTKTVAIALRERNINSYIDKWKMIFRN